jgi:hypothetical protein
MPTSFTAPEAVKFPRGEPARGRRDSIFFQDSRGDTTRANSNARAI